MPLIELVGSRNLFCFHAGFLGTRRRPRFAIALFLCVCRAALCGQIGDDCVVQTVVGSPITSSGDGGPAVAALFLGPLSLASDNSGDLYIADQSNSRIRMVSADGTALTIAGLSQRGFGGDGGPASLALLDQPSSVVVAPDGTLFVADTYNNRVRRISVDGNIDTVAGNGDAGFSGDEGAASDAQLYLPAALAHDGTNLYIADQGNFRIRMVDPSGIIHTYAGTGAGGQCLPFSILPNDGIPATQTSLCNVTALVADSRGQVYVGQNGSVFRILTDGTVQYMVGLRNPGAVQNPNVGTDGDPALAVSPNVSALAVAPDGTLYFSGLNLRNSANASVATVWAVDSSGLLQHLGSMRALAMTISPNGLLISSGDQVFLIDSQGDASLVAGQGTRGFGGDGGPGGLVKLSNPRGLAIDANSNVYFSDTDNARIRMLASGGTVMTVAGSGSYKPSGDGGSALAAGLPGPTSLAVDGTGDLFVLGQSGGVRKIDASGTITTYAGNGTAGPSNPINNGRLANSFALSPSAMAIGTSGSLFLGDQSGNVIWTVTPDDVAHVFVNKGVTVPFGQFVVDSLGNLIWDSYWDRSFELISPSGASQPLPALTPYLHGAAALAIDSQGALYGSSNNFGGQILRVGTDGTATTVVGAPLGAGSYDDGPASISLAGVVAAIAIDAEGNLYFADTFTARVRKLAASCLAVPISSEMKASTPNPIR